MLISLFRRLAGAIPARLNIGIMVFTACWVSYMLRVNMSINILEMVHMEHKNSNQSVKSECVSEDFKTNANHSVIIFHNDIHAVPIPSKNHIKYDWTSKEQGLILGAYFWGYIVTSLLGGFFAEIIGPKLLIGVSTFLSGVVTIITPLSANWAYEAVLASRFLIGGLGGVLYPALHCLVANWAPPEEKGKFMGALMGGTFGTVITWSLCGVILSYFGWEWGFYIPGIITIIWCVAWQYVVSDTPLDHPRINSTERSYILERIADRNMKKKPFPPLGKILLSPAFWGFAILHYGNIWGLYFQLTAGPKFIAQVLGFDISKAGIIASLPYLARVLMGFVFGSIGDFIRKRGKLSVTFIRKFFVIFSHFIPGLLLIALTFVGCDTTLSVLIVTASLGVNGAATLTNLQNHQDLSPNYVGILYSIANCFGSTTGFITPLITAHYTKERNGFEEWRHIFFIGASVYIVTGLIFMILGSGETQKWNEIVDTKNETEKPTTNIPNEKPDG